MFFFQVWSDSSADDKTPKFKPGFALLLGDLLPLHEDPADHDSAAPEPVEDPAAAAEPVPP